MRVVKKLNTSEGAEKGCIGNKWVNIGHSLLTDSMSLAFLYTTENI